MIATPMVESVSTPLHAAILRRIVARSSTLYERLDANRFAPAPEKIDAVLQSSRMDAWCEAIAKGEWDRFERCLSWDDMTLEQAQRAIQPVTLKEDAPLPDWTEALNQVFLIMATLPENQAFGQNEDSPAPNAAIPYRWIDPQAPLPFQEIFTPFVLYAQRELSRRTGAAYDRLTEVVHEVLERSLLGQLIDLAGQPLSLTFTSWRTGQQSSFGRFLTQMGGTLGRNLYLRFIEEMVQGQFIGFLEEYATLARLLTTLTTLWIEAQQEFIKRLDADWALIGEQFGKDISNAQVVAIQLELSDRHKGGRSVIAFRIGEDLPLIYKPKPLGIDRAYNDLLLWLNDQGCPLPFKVLQVIDRGDYGWVEYVISWHCADIEQVQRHYQRAGILLCLTYVLEATDCHHENLIASGEHPVLIDLETLLQPRLKIEFENLQSAHRIAIQQLANSVARTALLPVWEGEDDAASSFDYSGLGSQVQRTRTYKGLQWTAVNTDKMALTLQDIVIEPSFSHMPILDGKPTNLVQWIESVVEGFQQFYQFLLEKQSLLLAAESPFRAMAHPEIRFLFRRTNIYGKLLKQLNHPNSLKDGVDRSIYLEALKRSAAIEPQKPKFWLLIGVEREWMEQLDIPIFTLQANQNILTLPSQQRVEQFFEGSGYDWMWQRIQNLSPADLSMQVQYIRAMLGLRAITPHEMTSRDQEQSTSGSVSDEVLDDAALLAEAIAIAQRLQERAIQAPDGSVTWLSPQYSLQHERFEFQPSNLSLYDGKVGIALFLAALSNMTGEAAYRELCLRALHDFRRAADLAVPEPVRDSNFHLNLGLSSGLASSMYALTCIGRFLADDELLAIALDMVHLVTPDVIAADTYLDILGGTTGMLLSLLTLYDITQEQIALEVAISCGQSLLSRSVPTKNGRAWKTLSGRLLTGFSHGAAGIAYALLKLAQVTGDRTYQTAAEEGIVYEQSCFLPTIGNWSDLRDFSDYLLATGSTELPPLMSSWCHGATGIGLGRLGGLPIADNTAIRQDVQTAIQTTYQTLEQKREMVDQLCCGSMGRVDFLITASDRLHQPEMLTNARAQVSQVVHLARQKGGYTAEPGLNHSIYVPGFFRGEAGIGYTLLRLIAPQQFPSILLIE